MDKNVLEVSPETIQYMAVIINVHTFITLSKKSKLQDKPLTPKLFRKVVRSRSTAHDKLLF